MFVVQNRKTGLYLGYCTTVGDILWLDFDNRMVEKYDTIKFLKMDLCWVPWHWWWIKYKIIKI